MRKLPFVSLALLAAACSTTQPNFEMMSLYHEDGRAKPVVTVASMIDTTTYDCPWSLSEEMTSMIVKKMGETGRLFVHSNADFPFTENPFGGDLSWVKREFQNQEFVVFLELVEHESSPALRGKRVSDSDESATNLNMAVRIRVLDLRAHTPKIVLQEMVRDSYYIPKTIIPTNYDEIVWGSDEYPATPMAVAHKQLVQEIVSRVSDYVLLAKSR